MSLKAKFAQKKAKKQLAKAKENAILNLLGACHDHRDALPEDLERMRRSLSQDRGIGPMAAFLNQLADRRAELPAALVEHIDRLAELEPQWAEARSASAR
ncbi:MAG: hypothetical protein KDH88_16995 [Chromatiales bacterium]|nr:hypothetical protein [Chromatiales bacterium]